MQEWQRATIVTHPQLAGLALPQDDQTQQLIQELASSGRLTIIQHHRGIDIEASSFIGRIRLGELSLTIRPKVKGLPFLRLMQYAYGLHPLDLFSATSFDTEANSFQELLFQQLLAETNELVLHGLQKQYVQRHEALSSPRGRISFSAIANQGGMVQSTLPCTHYLRLEDSLINRVLKQGVRLAAQLTAHDALRMKLQRLERYHLPNISSLTLNAQTLKQVHRAMTRQTMPYLPVLTLIEILLAASGISVAGQPQDIALPGFLFDMNLFFQNLLYRFLSENLPDYEVQEQYVLDTVMGYVENPRKRQAPQLRPDYVVKQKGKAVAILDAKYRDLWQNTLPPHMLYQLIMYALGQDNCDRATILYPTMGPSASVASIEVRMPLYARGSAYVILRPVDLLHLDQLILQAREKKNDRDPTRFAHQLIQD
ncbi:McrC family protein [Dictyobacter kobayashii]|uniref:Restriction endonuclease n=1 Tax=Dictyobacter kobayashii TaxID=2014872 RepID=A0A402AWU3_9CHLR|nr:hypothetical protein [Dictyobacter kobayashii]GCE23611.1 hypothetical protein KDK_74110 [Dictyobacter kobayashii]